MRGLIVNVERQDRLVTAVDLGQDSRVIITRVQTIVGGWFYMAKRLPFVSEGKTIAIDSLWLSKEHEKRHPYQRFALSYQSIEFPFVGVGVIVGIDPKNNIDECSVYGSADYWEQRIRPITEEEAERLRMVSAGIDSA